MRTPSRAGAVAVGKAQETTDRHERGKLKRKNECAPHVRIQRMLTHDTRISWRRAESQRIAA